MLEITIPLPPRETHPNARCHWQVKSRAVRSQRKDAGFAALAALADKDLSQPRWRHVSIQATFYRPGSRDRKSDQMNLIGWLKPSEDGLQDAGIIENDRYVTWLPPKELLGAAAGGERKVVLLLTPLPAQG